MTTGQTEEFDQNLKITLDYIIQTATHFLRLIESRGLRITPTIPLVSAPAASSTPRCQCVERPFERSKLPPRANPTSANLNPPGQNHQSRENRQPIPNATSTPIRKTPANSQNPTGSSSQSQNRDDNVDGDSSYETIESGQFSVDLTDNSSVTTGNSSSYSTRVSRLGGESEAGSSSYRPNQSRSNNTTTISSTGSTASPNVTNSKGGIGEKTKMTRIEGRLNPSSSSNSNSGHNQNGPPCDPSRARRDAEILSIVQRIETDLQISIEKVRIIVNLLSQD